MGAITPLYRPDIRSSLIIVESALVVELYLEAVEGS